VPLCAPYRTTRVVRDSHNVHDMETLLLERQLHATLNKRVHVHTY